jgi:hypothetical protein
LGDAFGERPGLGFRFDDGKFLVAIEENEVGDFGGGATAVTFFSALGNAAFALDARTGDFAPTREEEEGGFNVLGSGPGFVHGAAAQSEALM